MGLLARQDTLWNGSDRSSILLPLITDSNGQGKSLSGMRIPGGKLT